MFLGAEVAGCFATWEANLLLLFLLLFFLLILLLLLNRGSLLSLLALWGLCVSRLLAGPLSEPLGQPLSRPLGPLLILLLPDGVQGLGTDDLPAALVQLLPVLVGPGVCPPLVLGVHADGRRVLAAESLRVESLLQGLLSQLSLLPLLQLLEVPLLLLPLLLVVVLVSLQLDHDVEQVGGLGLQVVGVQGLKVQGLDSDGEGDLLF